MLWRGAWKVVLEEFLQKWLFGQKEAGMQSCTEGLSVRTLALTGGHIGMLRNTGTHRN